MTMLIVIWVAVAAAVALAVATAVAAHDDLDNMARTARGRRALRDACDRDRRPR